MGKLNITPNLFLHSAELNRLVKFLDTDGFRLLSREQSASFGLVKTDPFTNFRVESGTAQGTLRLKTASLALNSDGNPLVQAPFDNLAVPSDGQWYWVKISYQASPNEEGTVSVDSVGNLTGQDTRFTDVLRGQPNFASVISFPDSQANVQRYEVVQVLSDSQAILAGGAIYQAESGLKIKVVGTFNPDFSPPLAAQDIFQYDGCKLELLPEAALNVAPVKLEGLEFYIARVRYDGAAVSIEDKRTEFWTDRGLAELTRQDRTASPLVGVESIKWADDYSTQTENIIQLGWGFRSDNWTTDPTLNRLTLIGGEGGKFKSTSSFQDGQFDGWRLYAVDGTYTRVVSSQKTGTQINLTLEVLNPDRYQPADLLTLVPDCEEVEFSFEHDTDTDNSTLLSKTYSFAVQAGVGRCDVLVPEEVYWYVIKYRTRQLNTYSPWRLLPNDDEAGYFREKSFDKDGILYTDPAKVERKRYHSAGTRGYIIFEGCPTSYRNFTRKIDLGDRLGVTVRNLDNANPVVLLTVGRDNQHQIFTSTGSLGLTVDHAVALSTEGAKAGNIFYLSFDAKVNAGDYKIGVYSGYVNAGNTGATLKTLTRTELDYMGIPRRRVSVKCVFTGKDWYLTTEETDPSRLGKIESFAEIDASDFDETGKGITEEVLGYRLCDGSNGTPNLSEQFIVGLNPAFLLDTTGTVDEGPYSKVGNTGGEAEVKLEVDNLPEHDHDLGIRIVDSGASYPFRFAHNGANGAKGSDEPLRSEKTGANVAHNNLPPYYVLVYLMRVPYN
jgi:hypothetical protein